MLLGGMKLTGMHLTFLRICRVVGVVRWSDDTEQRALKNGENAHVSVLLRLCTTAQPPQVSTPILIVECCISL